MVRSIKNNKLRTGGIGIGLAIVKAIAELHRGAVAVNSEKGKCAAFIITLPIEREKAKE